MAGIKKRPLLELLDKRTLRKLADHYELPVRTNAGHASLIDALMARRSIKVDGDILPAMAAGELKAACDYAELSRKGIKSVLVARLTSIQGSETKPGKAVREKKPQKAKAAKAKSPLAISIITKKPNSPVSKGTKMAKKSPAGKEKPTEARGFRGIPLGLLPTNCAVR